MTEPDSAPPNKTGRPANRPGPRREDTRPKISRLDRLALLTYRVSSTAVQALPVGISYRAASLVADVVFYAVWREKRRIVIENMRHVLGPRASSRMVQAAARRSVRNYAKYVVDFLRFPKLSRQEILQAIGIDSWERFDALLHQDRGVIFIGLHMGNWDLAGAAAGIRGYPFHVITDTIKPLVLDGDIQGIRRAKGMRILPMDQAARGVLRALRNKEMVGLLIDKPTPGSGVEVRFFDGPVWVPAGAATLALKTNARIIPGGVIRLPNNRFHLIIEDGFDYAPTGDHQTDVRQITQAVMTALEAMVRRHPEQWYMFRRMWPDTEHREIHQPAPTALGADA